MFFFVKHKMHRAVVGAYALLIAGGLLGYQAAQYRVNIRRLHNTFAALMALVVGLGLIKHTKKLMINERDVLAWGHFGGFAGFVMLCVWTLVAHNRQRKQQKKGKLPVTPAPNRPEG